MRYWLELFIFLTIIITENCVKIDQIDHQQSIQSIYPLLREGSLNKITLSNQRVLTSASEFFKLSYVVTTFLKNYDSRSSFCHYLCQSDSLLEFFRVQSCLQSYNCPSSILQNLFIVFLIISYGILPIIMICLGVWNFKCLSHNIAILTGVILISSIYTQLSKQFDEDMETDYDISGTQNTEQNNEKSTQGDN